MAEERERKEERGKQKGNFSLYYLHKEGFLLATYFTDIVKIKLIPVLSQITKKNRDKINGGFVYCNLNYILMPKKNDQLLNSIIEDPIFCLNTTKKMRNTFILSSPANIHFFLLNTMFPISHYIFHTKQQK